MLASATFKQRWFLPVISLAISYLLPLCASAGELVIHGPPGSVMFGDFLTLLPNGNFVVVDPYYGSNQGAVYLFNPAGTLVSTLTGSASGDIVGSNGVTVVGSNFVVKSSQWNGNAGAATWIDGNIGLAGQVSAANSLVGTNADDSVGGQVTVLKNGNYVVASPFWNGGGAVTWGNGNAGVSGAVSSSNSLIGGVGARVGDVIALENGNYVVASPNWNANTGAATWGNGSTGVTGIVSASNSLVGSGIEEFVASSVIALSNGNYVVVSSDWGRDNSGISLGAATWADGNTGVTGLISASNSLVGQNHGDAVGDAGVTALSNGNYVVASGFWRGSSGISAAGAATWGNGTTGIKGLVSVSNSLIGATAFDSVAFSGVKALANGNYVVSSKDWNNGAATKAGAATWGNGSTGTTGSVSPANSLVGTTADDNVGAAINALSNGNYVVASSDWNNGAATLAGAATWANGSTGIAGAVTPANSLVGVSANDQVGNGAANLIPTAGPDGVTVLGNGYYVVISRFWGNGAGYGAVTRAREDTGITGPVSAANSLIGTSANDSVGYGGVTALANGNYVVNSPGWNNNGATIAGAITWVNGARGLIGAVSASNSLVGTHNDDRVGLSAATAFSDGNYAVNSNLWNNIGAVTFASGNYRLKGTIQPWNSAIGTSTPGGNQMSYVYDLPRQRLIIGRAADNIVFTLTSDQLFADDFEP